MSDMTRTVTRYYCLPFQLMASFPLAVRYRTLPFYVMSTLQQIAYVESRYDYKATNPESSAEGLYQILDGTAKLKPLWKDSPLLISVPLQHLDLVLGKMSQPSGWNGGTDRLVIEHHGFVKFSDWTKNKTLDEDYYAKVKGAPFIPIPPIAIIVLPTMLIL